MTKENIVPIVLSGGTGSRLWPLSRELNPKQFQKLISDQSMLQETLSRLKGVADLDTSVVVCNEAHRFLVAEQLRNMGIENASIILEPKGRNTAPAIAVAALDLLSHNNCDPIMLILPADHVISDISQFHQAIGIGCELASEGKLVTFGIVPNRPETGYGYIRQGKSITENSYQVAAFVEKPDSNVAQSYLDSGDYLWNSGMFMFRCSSFLSELESLQNDIYAHTKAAIDKAKKDNDFIRLDKDSFLASPSDSIDYAVMEKTEHAVVIPLDAGWSDVGAWDSLWDVSIKDEQGNFLSGDILTEQVSNTYIHADEKLVAAVGIDNCVIVETADAVLVADKSHAQSVKQIVEKLKEQKREEVLLHQQVFRPWGSYETLVEQLRFKVKRIIVTPGSSLSLQMHHHRAEHWVVVHGTAKVTQ
ncbi:MAG: mannose-1-phosphate guanylyltransferase/mannose-6-phosphate isomerase, partial [Gammaproteobacteria bacterium]|nr:mannose-1-phosphate guanylyltransferase/mannose-6-phosphate isomerase [Gammaproteobacteria bacterium]